MKILITNNALDRLAGTETFVYTIAKELQDRGHEVRCYSPTLGEIAEKIRELGIPVSDKIKHIPDVIHGHHFEPTTEAYERTKAPVVFIKHGHIYEQEAIPNIPIKKLFVVSEELKEMVGGEILRNPIDLERFKPTNEKGAGNLFLSNHPIMYSFCKYTNQNWQIEKLINESEVVITLGRGALEAMACNKPTIIYGRFGADGLVTKENFNLLKIYNFSGRLYKKRWDEDDLKKEINKALRLKPQLRHLVETEYDVKKVTDKLEKAYEKAIRHNDY